MNIYASIMTEAVSLWHLELIWSLKDMGHQVFSPRNIGLDESWARVNAGCWASKHRATLSQRLLEDVKRVSRQESLDLFIALFSSFQFVPQVFKDIERLGIPTVLFHCDNLNFHEMAEEFARYFTLTWVPELKAVEMYQRLGVNYIYLPMAANPNFNRPNCLPEQRNVTFIGTKSPYRRWLLGTLLGRDVPLEIYGCGWQENSAYYHLDTPSSPTTFEALSWHERLANFMQGKRASLKLFVRYGPRPRLLRDKVNRMGEEFEALTRTHASSQPVLHDRVMELYAESRVTLGINHHIDPGCSDLWNLAYSRARDFEAPMSGACYLTQYTEELDRFYPEENVIMTYRSIDDLCSKVHLLLRDKELRDVMRRNARQFCLEHHTWQHRFQRLFERLGLKDRPR